jgi:hypothetical protein
MESPTADLPSTMAKWISGFLPVEIKRVRI